MKHRRNLRDLDQLFGDEVCHTDRQYDEYMSQCEAAHVRRQQQRRAIDEAEQGMPWVQDGPQDNQEPRREMQSVCLQRGAA